MTLAFKYIFPGHDMLRSWSPVPETDKQVCWLLLSLLMNDNTGQFNWITGFSLFSALEADQVLIHLLANNWRKFDNISNVLGMTRQTIFQVGRSSEKQFFPTAEKIYNYYCSLCEYHMCSILCCGKWWCSSTSITINLFTVVLTLLAQYNACYVENSFHTHCKNVLFEWASCWCFVKFVLDHNNWWQK